MKLRNKRTGEIVEYDSFGFRKGLSNGWNDFIPNADSLTELNEKWEDYEPPMPEIKGGKICKIVRDWYEYHDTDSPIYCEDACTLSINHGVRIEFMNRVFRNLEQDYTYTITELCGEEK